MPNRGQHWFVGEQGTGFAGTLRRMFGKSEVAKTREDDGHLTGRVAEVSARMGPRTETYCPDCGFGIMRVVGDPPARVAVEAGTASQKLPPASGSLQCDRCDYLVMR